jgi:hypothetical protein
MIFVFLKYWFVKDDVEHIIILEFNCMDDKAGPASLEFVSAHLAFVTHQPHRNYQQGASQPVV